MEFFKKYSHHLKDDYGLTIIHEQVHQAIELQKKDPEDDCFLKALSEAKEMITDFLAFKGYQEDVHERSE